MQQKRAETLCTCNQSVFKMVYIYTLQNINYYLSCDIVFVVVLGFELNFPAHIHVFASRCSTA
jgi:hypothetical protein